MLFENTKVFNFEGAIRGMRNPKESWDLSDSHFDSSACPFSDDEQPNCTTCSCFNGFGNPCWPRLGEKDLKLAQRLIRAGSEHRKFMRQIIVSVDITAPIYWWKEFDTYKVGTVANSTSTMHTIHEKPISMSSFDTDDCNMDLPLIDDANVGMRAESFITDFLEQLRQKYLMEKDERTKKRYWKELIRWLPSGWLQKRTVTMTYENLLAMCSIGQRRFHKLSEWSGRELPSDQTYMEWRSGNRSLISWARSELPYAEELIFLDMRQPKKAAYEDTIESFKARHKMSDDDFMKFLMGDFAA